MTKTELFLELASPDKTGCSRWVKATEFTGRYKDLQLGNGGSWCRKESTLAKQYIVKFDKSLTVGNSIDAIRLCGLNTVKSFNQNIRPDIRKELETKNCVMLGIQGTTVNTTIEIDHKDGRKNDERVSDLATQKLDDFQPLTKAANDAKRQICKKCTATDCRWDARNLDGNPIAYYRGGQSLSENGCIGCYQYDPVEYRKEVIRKAKKGEI